MAQGSGRKEKIIYIHVKIPPFDHKFSISFDWHLNIE
jgi:hypothetical protein